MFLSFCLLISIIPFSFADDLIENIDVTSFAPACLCNFRMRDGQDNTYLFDVNQFLPSLNAHGIPVKKAHSNSLAFNYLYLDSDGPFDGYYSFYLIFDFYNNVQSNLGWISDFLTYLLTVQIKVGNQLISPIVEIGIRNSAPDYSVSQSVYYHFTAWMRWDFIASDVDRIEYPSTWGSNIYSFPATYDFMCVPCNVSLVKYQSQEQFSYSSDLNSIASLIQDTNDDLEGYLPQIVSYLSNQDDYLNQILDYQSDSTSYLENIKDRLIVILSEIRLIIN